MTSLNFTLAPLTNKNLVVPLDNDTIKAQVYALAAPTNIELNNSIKDNIPIIEEVSKYIFFNGGKRIRPVLFMIASAAAGKPGNTRLATIFEYLHAATLLHDDVIDKAGFRRGHPAARIKYDNDIVILVGDFLFSKCYSLAAEETNHNFITALTDCTTHMAEGQIMELIYTNNLNLSIENYFKVILSKTAVLLASACQMGAIYAGANNTIINSLYVYGMELGIAYQMIDDALDYIGTQHEIGKPVGHDLAEGKITLPFIYVRDHTKKNVRDHLIKLTKLSKNYPKLIEEAKEIIRIYGGVEATYNQAHAHAIRAQEALEILNPIYNKINAKTQKLLLSLPHYILTRHN